jgi:hypothetical protein
MDREFAVDLRYVAILRVKTLDGLLFEEPFDYDRALQSKLMSQ